MTHRFEGAEYPLIALIKSNVTKGTPHNMMRKTIFFLLALSVLFTSCEKKEAESHLTITQSVLQLAVGEFDFLYVRGTTGKVVWTSSDEDVATVDDGYVEAKGVGTTRITASVGSNEVYCDVYVNGADGATLRITPVFASIARGESVQLTGRNALDLPAVWSSSDETIATVDENGLVTGHKGGNATISFTSDWETVSITVAVKHEWNDYQLVWSDEFEGNELNLDNWTIEVNGNGGGNNEAQYYTDRRENIRVEDGNLIIQARKEPYLNKEYTSGRINSRNKQMFTYGKIEARINLPSGRGTWPAFWTLGLGSWPRCGEIDIMEHTGNAPNRVLWTLHTQKDRSGSRSNKSAWLENIVDNYHVYGVEWMQEETDGHDVIKFYVDDVVYNVQTEGILEDVDSWPFNKPNYIILNLALGGTLGGSIDDAIFEHDVIMKVDWVRVYQRTEKE